MTSTSNPAPLTHGQQRFADLLRSTPYLEPFWHWDIAEAECDLDALRSAMGAWSHGERIMAQFMAGLWLGADKFDFDVFEAAGTLDRDKRAVIAKWMEDPFWP